MCVLYVGKRCGRICTYLVMSDVGDVGVIYFPSPSKHEVMVVMYSCTLTLVYYPREPVGEMAE